MIKEVQDKKLRDKLKYELELSEEDVLNLVKYESAVHLSQYKIWDPSEPYIHYTGAYLVGEKIYEVEWDDSNNKDGYRDFPAQHAKNVGVVSDRESSENNTQKMFVKSARKTPDAQLNFADGMEI